MNEKENNNQEESKKDNQEESKKKENNTNEDKNKDKGNKEELDQLLKAIKKLEEDQNNNGSKKPKRKMIAIEFGGAFHPNIFANFAFQLLMNLTIAYLLIELFSFAKYSDILFVIGFFALYTFLEYGLRIYLMKHYFKWILRSFGFVFFLGYLILFFLLDTALFGDTFYFITEAHFVVFLLLFTGIRYGLTLLIRRQIRQQHLR